MITVDNFQEALDRSVSVTGFLGSEGVPKDIDEVERVFGIDPEVTARIILAIDGAINEIAEDTGLDPGELVASGYMDGFLVGVIAARLERAG